MASLEQFYEFLNEWENETKVMVGMKIMHYLKKKKKKKLTQDVERIINAYIDEPHITSYCSLIEP